MSSELSRLGAIAAAAIGGAVFGGASKLVGTHPSYFGMGFAYFGGVLLGAFWVAPTFGGGSDG